MEKRWPGVGSQPVPLAWIRRQERGWALSPSQVCWPRFLKDSGQSLWSVKKKEEEKNNTEQSDVEFSSLKKAPQLNDSTLSLACILRDRKKDKSVSLQKVEHSHHNLLTE